MNDLETQAANIYDSDAVQTFPFSETDGDSEVRCKFSPLPDERYAEYTRAAKTKIVDDGASLVSENGQALVDLWNDLALDIEGVEGDKPENWKDEVDDFKEKVPSMSAYLAVVAYSPKRVWGQTDSATYTDAYFNGELNTQKHFLRKKTVEDIKTFRRFQKVPLGSKSKGLESSEITISSYAVEKGQLYDRMKEREAEGYAARVPLAHKVAVIDHEFSAGLTQKK